MMTSPVQKSIPVTTQKIVCPTCDHDNSTIKYQINISKVQNSSIWIDNQEFEPDLSAELNIVSCQDCGLYYINPQPRLQPNQMSYSYQAEIRYFNRTKQQRENAYRELFSKIPDILGRQPKTHLDFGCGDGIMIGVARDFGVSSFGTEISQPLIHFVNDQYGPGTIINYENQSTQPGTFDVITLINVIEHVTQPLHILNEIKQRLQPDGIVLIHTINIGGIPARISKQNWSHIEPLGHFFYFTKGSLMQMLNKAGFQIIGRFDLKTGGRPKQVLQELFGRMNLHLDNGLGVVARLLANN